MIADLKVENHFIKEMKSEFTFFEPVLLKSLFWFTKMFKKGFNVMRFKDLILFRGNSIFRLYKQDIFEQNKKTYPVFLWTNFILSCFFLLTLNFLSNYFWVGVVSIMMASYSLIILLVFSFLYKKIKTDLCLGILYLLMVPIYVLSLIRGSVCIGNNPGYSFIIYILVLPNFMLDKPVRNILFQIPFVLSYILLCFFNKEGSLILSETIHIIEAFIASTCLILFCARIRFDNLKNYITVREQSEHNDVTGLKNKHALNNDYKNYFFKNIIVCMIDIDDFKFFNDMYGHQVGDEVLKSFGDILIQSYGKDSCYSYGGDEFLIISKESDFLDFKKKILIVKKQMNAIELDKSVLIKPNFSVGFTYGKPTSLEEFMDMISKADFLLYESKSNGKDRIYDMPYSPRANENPFQSKTSSSLSSTSKQEDNSMRAFYKSVEKKLKEVSDSRHSFCICAIAIHNFNVFKELNGYKSGEKLLDKIQKNLSSFLPDGILTHINDDRFYLFSDKNDIIKATTKINQQLSKISYSINLFMKCGIFLLKKDIPLDLAMNKAITALNSVNEEDKHRYRIIDEKLENEKKITFYVLSNLETAIADKKIAVYYQPIMRCVSGSIIAFEAFSRWIDENDNIIYPDSFIKILEQHKLIPKLDLYVIEVVCQKMREKIDLGIQPLPISINLSKIDFDMMDVVTEVTSLCDKYRIDHSLLIMEITESTMVENKSIPKEQISRFQQSGFQVWMDDFGSNYSALNLLKDYDFDVIKIDMKFLRDNSHQEKGKIIIDNIVKMAKEIHLQTLTEGVENETDFRFLQKIGCEMAQGYLFAKPFSFEQLEDFLINGPYSIERREEKTYYDEISMISLSSPTIHHQTYELSSFPNLPTAIIEYRNEEIHILRTNKAFFYFADRYFERTKEPSSKPKALWSTSSLSFMKEMITPAIENEDWQSKSFSLKGNKIDFYLKFISKNPVTQASSFFLVIHQNKEEN